MRTELILAICVLGVLALRQSPSAFFVALVIFLLAFFALVFSRKRENSSSSYKELCLEVLFPQLKIGTYQSDSDNLSEVPYSSAAFNFGKLVFGIGHFVIALSLLGVVLLAVLGKAGGVSGVPIGVGLGIAFFFYIIGGLIKYVSK